MGCQRVHHWPSAAQQAPGCTRNTRPPYMPIGDCMLSHADSKGHVSSIIQQLSICQRMHHWPSAIQQAPECTHNAQLPYSLIGDCLEVRLIANGCVTSALTTDHPLYSRLQGFMHSHTHLLHLPTWLRAGDVAGCSHPHHRLAGWWRCHQLGHAENGYDIRSGIL